MSSDAERGVQVRVSSDGVFYTLQGEGPLLGVPSVFVRLDTCNLKCKWGDTLCDAHYTSWTPSGTVEPLEVLRARVREMMHVKRCRNLVITGGEPALQPAVISALTRDAHAPIAPRHVTVETNGTRHGSWALDVDLICISPKLASSTPVGTKFESAHARNRWNPDVVSLLIDTARDYYFKFVIDTEDDIAEVARMLESVGQVLPDPEHVLFMPQGITPQELWERGRWLAEWCKEHGVRFTPRLQVDLWGNTPGT